MIIIIEGPDGVGKSTIVKNLSKKLKFDIVRMPKAKKAFKNGTIEDLSYVFNQTLRQLKPDNIIMDRGYYSSVIYSRVFKRDAELQYIADIDIELYPFIFFLDAKNDILKSRRKNDKVIDDKFRNLVAKEYRTMYKQLRDIKRNRLYQIDTSKLTPNEIVDKILNNIYE